MPQRVVGDVRFEFPITGEGVEAYTNALTQAEKVGAAITELGGKVVSTAARVRQTKTAKTAVVVAPETAPQPAHGHLVHPAV